jgi:hypothetical protein
MQATIPCGLCATTQTVCKFAVRLTTDLYSHAFWFVAAAVLQAFRDLSGFLAAKLARVTAFRTAQQDWACQLNALYDTPATSVACEAQLQQLQHSSRLLVEQVQQIQVRWYLLPFGLLFVARTDASSPCLSPVRNFWTTRTAYALMHHHLHVPTLLMEQVQQIQVRCWIGLFRRLVVRCACCRLTPRQAHKLFCDWPYLSKVV